MKKIKAKPQEAILASFLNKLRNEGKEIIACYNWNYYHLPIVYIKDDEIEGKPFKFKTMNYDLEGHTQNFCLVSLKTNHHFYKRMMESSERDKRNLMNTLTALAYNIATTINKDENEGRRIEGTLSSYISLFNNPAISLA